LIDKGLRRRLFQLTFDQLAVALAAVFAGAILLLLIGTQILEWYWLGLLFAASFGYGLWTVLRRAPSQYQIAQLIDARLHLYDAVSTAFHFANAREPITDEIRDAQSRQAQEAAASADIRTALPYQWPKFTLWTGGLALAALSLFGIRYLITQSLDTKPSLVAMAFENFFTPSPDRPVEQARNQKKRPLDPELEKLGVQVNDSETQRNDLDPGNDATNIVDTPETNNPDSNADGKSKAKTDQVDVKAQGKENGDEEGEKGKDNADSQGKESGDQGNAGGEQQPPKANQKQSDKKGDQKSDQSNLLDKMKDAMANMLNKLKMDGQQQQQKQQQAQNSKEGQQSGKGQQKSDDKSQQDKNGDQKGGQGEQKEQNAQAQGEQGQKQENAQGKGGEQGKQPQSPDAKSGIGKSDGNKDVEEAENAKAMGKISEILGKRQKDVTGEMMIEVSSGKQQLKTAYSNQSATHKEAGGEINRDEVPLIYQQYVEKYFDQIHAVKPPSAEPTATVAKPAGSGPKVPGAASPGTSGPAK
jgi:hypothetical protein